jgi:hypothetical protein
MNVNFAILIPAAKRDDLQDTLESILHYEPNVPIYVLKDFDGPIRIDPRVIVIPPLPYKRNALGGLLQKKLWAFDYIMTNTNVDVVLTLDADALVIRSGIFESVLSPLENINSGCLGCCRVSPSGAPRSFMQMGKTISRFGGFRALRIRDGRSLIKEFLKLAKTSDYELGAHAISCAVFFKRELLEEWQSRGWLENHGLSEFPIPDDGMLGLMTYASGYKIGEIGGPNGLINVAWKGLSAAPEQLNNSGAFIIHSVRKFEEMTEIEIRSFFRRIRETEDRT